MRLETPTVGREGRLSDQKQTARDVARARFSWSSLALFFAFVAGASCLVPGLHAGERPKDAVHSEEYRVYEAVLRGIKERQLARVAQRVQEAKKQEEYRAAGTGEDCPDGAYTVSPETTFVVRAETRPEAPFFVSDGRPEADVIISHCEQLRSSLPPRNGFEQVVPDRDLVEDWIAIRGLRTRLDPKEIELPVGYAIAEAAQIESLYARVPRSEYMRQLTSQFGAPCTVVFSRVAFGKDRQQAAVTFTARCGTPSCTSSWIYLEKIEGEWRHVGNLNAF